MSQLRNLLTNKVAKYQHGSRKSYRRSLGYILPMALSEKLMRNRISTPAKPA